MVIDLQREGFFAIWLNFIPINGKFYKLGEIV